MCRLLCGSPLDQTPEGPLIDPDVTLLRLEADRQRCESVIAYLELEGTVAEKDAFRDQVWPLRKMLEDLIALIRLKQPENPPPDDEDMSDVPF